LYQANCTYLIWPPALSSSTNNLLAGLFPIPKSSLSKTAFAFGVTSFPRLLLTVSNPCPSVLEVFLAFAESLVDDEAAGALRLVGSDIGDGREFTDGTKRDKGRGPRGTRERADIDIKTIDELY